MYSIQSCKRYSARLGMWVWKWYLADIRGVRMSVYMSQPEAEAMLAALQKKQ